MRRVRQWLLGALAVLLLIVAGSLLYGYTLVRRPFPQTTGTLTLAGLKDNVTVLRDPYGIPHLYASNPDDLFFAQGYVHAQDRFWQMEFWRHVGQGRLSEIVGDATIETDTFIRTMGWNRIAQETLAYYEANEPEAMALLTAYSAGVNAYLDAHRGNFSINHAILAAVGEPWEIEPWEPLDTIGWSVVMSDDLSGNWGAERERAQLIAALGEEKAAQLLPLYPYDQRPVIAPTDQMGGEARGEAAPRRHAARQTTPLASRAALFASLIGSAPPDGWLGAREFVGSNNWVIGGEHTDTGMPLLADDPHLGIQMPSIWYEVGLHAPGWNVVGFSFAGVPGVVIGHNEHIAWGVTNVGPDVQDLYIERINPDNPNQYEFEGEWRDMALITETIRVNGGEDVPLTVRQTHHGPLITPLLDDTEEALAFRWTAAEEPSRLFKSIILLNQAQDYEAFREALRYWDVPAQNFVYADVEGNIAYQMPGLVPIRAGGNGLVPVPGWTGEYEWEGWVPYDELPHLLNPEQGFIVTANNAVVDEDYPYLIELQWDNGDRAQRITEMIREELSGDGTVSAEDIARMHMDAKSLLAEHYLPLLTDLRSPDPQVQAALERFDGWDAQLRRDSVPAALWEIFYLHLHPALLADDFPPVAEEQLLTGRRVFLHQLAEQPDAPWWDDTTTPEAETRDQILLRAMVDTVAWFEDNVGGEMDGWTWGRIHRATFVSNPLGQSGIAAIEQLVNRGPYPVDGSSSAVNATGWSFHDPAAVTGHPSMRMIVDLGDFDRSLSVHPTGQSGHPMHSHYFDLFELWQNGKYHPMLWSQEAVEEAARDRLTLQPTP